MNEKSIEAVRLELERERLLLEQRRTKREGRLLNRHFGAIITAVVSIAAVFVSYAQIHVAYINKSRDLAVKNLEGVRQWRIEAAKFVASNRDAIFSPDDEQRQTMRYVISVAFPEEISNGLLVSVRKAESGSLLRRFWKPDGMNINKANAEKLRTWLKENNIAGVALPFFFRAARFQDARVRAVKELGLEGRQSTITNVPDASLAAVKRDFELDGATVTARRQADGKWTVTATFPESSR